MGLDISIKGLERKDTYHCGYIKFNVYRKEVANAYNERLGELYEKTVCIHDRKIIRPELPVITSRIKAIFTSKKPYQKLSEIMYRLDKANLVVEE